MDIFESVFAVQNRKSDNFQCDRTTNSTHFLCSYVAVHTLCIPAPYYSSVGHCIVYYRKVLSEPLFYKRNQLHTFFFIITAHSGLMGKHNYLKIMSVYEFEQRFLDEHLEEILQKLGREFISDSFVKVFAKCYPQEYANALLKSAKERSLNVWIARWYLSRCPRVRKGELCSKSHTTTNNNTSHNRLWVKI